MSSQPSMTTFFAQVHGLDENRLKHSYSVGLQCSQIYAGLFGTDRVKRSQLIVLGLLHDIGYQYTNIQTEHNRAGGEVLRSLGFTFWQDVFWHGDSDCEWWSDELTALNLADLTVSHTGEPVTIAQRLESVAGRYGSRSVQIRECERLVDRLRAECARTVDVPGWNKRNLDKLVELALERA